MDIDRTLMSVSSRRSLVLRHVPALDKYISASTQQYSHHVKNQAFRKVAFRRGFLSTGFFLISVITLIAIFCVAGMSRLDGHQRPNNIPLRARSGNQEIASDLYGNGVRVGLYLQVFGMLLSAASLHVGGIKIAASGTMIALLVCWTKLARGLEFSPCEAHLVSAMVGIGGITGSIAALVPDNSSFVGTLAAGVAGLWALVAGWWLWASLYARLPLLGTQNLIWFFTPVRIDGWVRIFMLVLFSILTLLLVVSTISSGVVGYKAAKHGIRTVTEEELNQIVEDRIGYIWTASAVSLFTLILVIAGAEMVIRYNGLEPETVIAKPGQAIPLTIGIVVFIDGVVSFASFLVSDRNGQTTNVVGSHVRAK